MASSRLPKVLLARFGVAAFFVYWSRFGILSKLKLAATMHVKPQFAVLALALTVVGCGETNLVRDVAQGTGLAGRPAEPVEFVRASRADAPSGFMPVGVNAPARPTARRTEAEFKTMEQQLEADRLRLEAQGEAARRAGAATQPPKPPSVPQ